MPLQFASRQPRCCATATNVSRTCMPQACASILITSLFTTHIKRLSTVQRYEALHLAKAVLQAMPYPVCWISSQYDALTRFELFKIQPDSSLCRLGWADGARALASNNVLPTPKIFNALFFFNAVIIDFRWRDLGSDTLGECSPDGLIHMSPTALDIQENSHHYTECVLRMQSRLGTLLHEMIHAYLFQFACEECPTFDFNIRNADGHGRCKSIGASVHSAAGYAITCYLRKRL
jgi:hypothetical protein